MGFFLLKRFFTLVATLLGASVVVFVVLDILPGNAAQPTIAPFSPTDSASYNETTSVTVYDSLGVSHVQTRSSRVRDSRRAIQMIKKAAVKQVGMSSPKNHESKYSIDGPG